MSEPLLSDGHEESKLRGNTGNSLRCRALDAFRGLTLCLMVFVNYGGGGVAVFKHSVWDGLTMADLVFPWFAWIMGFSTFLSSSGRRYSLIRAIQRAVKLFALGLFVNNGDSWSEWRIPGVLQSLSVAYLAVTVASWCFPRHNHGAANQHRMWGFVSWHLMFGVIPLTVTNLLLTFALHVPGCPTGYIGPGDTVVFGLHHVFKTPTCQQRYQTGPYDPEGFLNWLMVAATAYIGYLQAALFTEGREQHNFALDEVHKHRIRHLLVSGSGLVLLSIACGGLWLFPGGPWIPLNKNLWSLSTVGAWRGAPFNSVGKNSIAIYVMHETCQHFAPFAAKPVTVGEDVPHFELLFFNLVGMFTWIVVAQWMDLQRIFIKV
ncbi:Heparan-alpha-glucosaminide N-acetyltransferase [Phytophthora ramorum]|uniref:Heparan-alpha-glucosaminide N-acetyltransferase n=1 Tax=Phytophthora ramorum TaxID=164328 RepID=UPI0030ACB820|nr:Heparan-alpha-glucosaminide N-acetyltransferase [Phytophthora ramorum]